MAHTHLLHRAPQRLLLAFAASAIAGTTSAAPLPMLRITDLSVATGLPGFRVVDLNNAGEVLGHHKLVVSYLWRPGAQPQRIGSPSDDLAPTALNDAGQVVGKLVLPGGSAPFIWDAVHGVTRLHLPPGVQYGSGEAINLRGRVAGTALAWNWQESDWRKHAIVGSARVGMSDPMRNRHTVGHAMAINNRDHVGGAAWTPGTCCYSAVLVRAQGRIEWLGTLAAPGEDDYSVVEALNDDDVAVGHSNITGATPHAFYWSRATGMVPLRVGPGEDDWSLTRGVNRLGQVVGGYGRGMVASSFYWDADHGSVDLHDRLDPADPLTPYTRLGDSGARINDRGQIVVNATIAGVATAVLLTPLD